MTSDDEFFFDYLASIPNDVKHYSLQVADSIDRHVDRAATVVRDTLSHQQWIPSSIRPVERTKFFSSPALPPRSMVGRAQDWAYNNRAWAAAILAFIGTGSLVIYGTRKLSVRKRKARRAANGARKEIVVVVGSPHEAITKSVTSDLERRGYIVFVTVASTEEERVIQNEGREDIRSLWLDLSNTPTSPSETHPSLYAIQSLITHPQVPSPGMQPHICQLRGVVLIPSPNYPTGPISTIPASSWADTMNTRLLYPILAVQLLLPLLTMKNSRSSVVLLSPSIQSSLSAPFASPEVAITRGLSGFAKSLRQELRVLELGGGSIEVVEVKLGNIDFGRQFRGGRGQTKGTEVLTWQPQQRLLYGSPYLSTIDYRFGTTTSSSGSSARELHFAVFDALAAPPKSWLGKYQHKKQTVYVGRGARTYAIIGNIFPNGFIGWMLGLRTGSGGSLPDAGRDDTNSGSESGWEKVS